jgi:hypothetical protein
MRCSFDKKSVPANLRAVGSILLERKAQRDYSNLMGPLASLSHKAHERRRDAETQKRGNAATGSARIYIPASPIAASPRRLLLEPPADR